MKESLNELLVYLFNHIMDIERNELITGEFSDITTNDMHIIEAVGLKGHRNMSAVAQQLGITVGTLTITINRLVKKGYVIRQRNQQGTGGGRSRFAVPRHNFPKIP